MASAREFVLGLNPVIRRDEENRETRMQPLAQYLAQALGMPVRIVIEPDYDTQIAAMRAGNIDAAFFGEYAFQKAQSEAGAEALAVSVEAGSESAATYQSVIVARADSAIRTLADLKKQRVGFVDRGSTAGYLIPRRMLREAGLDPDADIAPVFLHSHRAVLDGVYRGEVAAGALHRNDLLRLAESDPAAAAELRTVAVSPPIPKGPFAVRKGLDRDTRQRLLQALLRIHDDAPDAAVLTGVAGTRWRPASTRSVTLKTVAALSGVSYGTVSRVINGRAHVAPETYTRVMSIVQDLGFRPNAAAVNLIANRSDLVGFVVPDAGDAAIAAYTRGIQRALTPHDLHLVLCPTGSDRETEAYYLGLLDDGRLGGAIVTEWSLETPLVSTLAATGRPLVLLGAGGGGAPVPSVAPDYDALCIAAVEYLRGLGHTQIGAVVAAMETPITRALRNAGCTNRVPIAPHAFDFLRERDPDLSAVIVETADMAMALLLAASATHLHVPDDLSVIALEESWYAGEIAAPSLTTATLSLEAVGARAVAMLVEQMSGGELAAVPGAAVLPVVVPRGSTATRHPVI